MLKKTSKQLFNIEKFLGEGSLGKVFLAQGPQGKTALKFLKSGLPGQALSFFREEVRLQSRLSHPNLVKIYEFYDAEVGWDRLAFPAELAAHFKTPAPFFTMEFVEGVSLEGIQLLEVQDKIVIWLRQLAQGLHYLHVRGILHRDLKPSNILLSPSGVLKILDFGLSLEVGQAKVSEAAKGTLAYMAPEVFLGNYDARSDLFSLGVLCYKLLTGKLPYLKPLTPEAIRKFEPPRGFADLRPPLPDFLLSLLAKLLEISPGRRPQSSRVVQRYLEQHIEIAPGEGDAEEAPIHLEKVTWVGRDLQLKALDECLTKVEREKLPRGIALQGPTGSGRSRLLEEWKWRAMLKGWLFQSIGPEAGPGWLKNLLGSWGVEDAPSADWLSQARRALQMREDRPAALAFTDLNRWGKEAGRILGMFSDLVFQGKPQLVLIWELNTDWAEPEFMKGLAERDQACWDRVSLGEFSTEEAEDFLLEAAQGFPLSGELRKKILAAAGGRPLLLLEALRGIAAGAGLPARELEIRIPRNLQEAAQQRLESLSQETKLLLGLVLTHPVSLAPPDLEPVFSPMERLLNCLLELDRRGFFQARSPEHPEIALFHPSLKETLLEALPPEPRRASHQAWIRALTGRLDPDAPNEEIILQLLTHALGILDTEVLVKWSIRGLEILEKEGQFETLAEWAEQMINIDDARMDRTHLHALRAPNFYRLGRFPESRQAYRDWYERRKKDDDETRLIRVRFHFYLGLVFFAEGKYEDSRRELTASLEAGDSTRHAALRPFHARVLNLLGALEERSGDLSRAKAYLRRALSVAEGSPNLLGEAHQRLGSIAQSQMNYPEAEEHLRRAVEACALTGSPQIEAVSLQALGLFKRELGRLREARGDLVKSADMAREGGEILQWGRYLGNLALIELDLCEYQAAAETLEESRRILDFLGRDSDRLLNLFHSASLASWVGNRERFETLIRQLEGRGVGKGPLGRSLQLLVAEDRYRRGDFSAAHDLLVDCLQGAEAGRGTLEDLHALSLALRLLHADGALDPSSPWVVKEVESLRVCPNPMISFWAQGLAFFLRDGEDLEEGELAEWFRATQALDSEESRMESLELTALHLGRHGMDTLAGEISLAAQEEWDKIFNRLPEEFKMDYEKNRRLRSLEEAMKAKPSIPASAKAPAGTPSEASAKDGEAATAERNKISNSRFRQFCEINRQISQKTDVEEILERVMDAAIELTGAERGFLLLKNEKQKEAPFAGFEVRTARHLNQRSLQEEEFQFSFSAVKAAVTQGAPLLTDNAQQDERFQSQASVMQFQLKSILVVPLELEGQILGAVYLDHRYQLECFSEQDVMMLSGFASQAALAIQKAQWMDELKHQVQDQSQQIQVLAKELSQARSGLKYEYEEIIGKSPAMMRVFKLLDHVSKTRIPVWIFGESGTGKELIARSLHVNSPRKEGPFISENCSAIPENLLESELFGFKKGSFTHADRDRVGLVEQADGGTLFLDEVGDMSMAMQVKLLRVLQEGEVRPLGATKKIKIDVRLVTASNKDLNKMVKEGTFRQDLFFRINGLTIKLPSLGQRKADIPLLVHHFVKKIAKEYDLPVAAMTREALEYLMGQPWPGNIRELEGVVRNALLFAEGRPITREFFTAYEGWVGTGEMEEEEEAPEDLPLPPSELSEEQSRERRELIEAMIKHQMDKKLVADELKISLKSVYARMERYGVPKKRGILQKFLEEQGVKG